MDYVVVTPVPQQIIIIDEPKFQLVVGDIYKQQRRPNQRILRGIQCQFVGKINLDFA